MTVGCNPQDTEKRIETFTSNFYIFRGKCYCIRLRKHKKIKTYKIKMIGNVTDCYGL
jgi:hypothetical protein